MPRVTSAFSRVGVVLALSIGTCFAFVTDANVYLPPSYNNFMPPVVGGKYTDPVFGTQIKRITDAMHTNDAYTGTPLSFITGEYSTMSPFNQNDTFLLLIHQSYFALYDGLGQFIRSLPLEINSSCEPRWSRSNPDIFYYINQNQLRTYDVVTGAISVVHTFSNYSRISGMGESDISYDGDHFVFAGDSRYVFVYEISTDTVGPRFDTGGKEFDSLYITPDNHVSITWLQLGAARYSGIELFDRKMNFIRQLARAGGHMHYTRDFDGQEVLVWFNANDPTPVVPNAVVKIRVSTGQQVPLLSLDWSLVVHISAPDSTGYAFVETYAPADPSPRSGWVPYANELLQVRLDGKEVRRLAHHRSRPSDRYNYEPRLSVSRDGLKLMYSSNFGLQRLLRLPNMSQDYTDVYLIAPQQGPQIEFIPNTKSAPLPRKSHTGVTYPLTIGVPRS